MEFDDNNVRNEEDEGYVEIYSKKAVFWFSLLASPLFGSILLMINLKAAGLMRGFYSVLVFLVLYVFASEFVLGRFLLTHKLNFNVLSNDLFIFYGITLGFNIISAFILTFYFFNKYFPDNDYYPKSITTPVIVTVLAIIIMRIIGLG